jgi:hypothetical protein
MSARAYVVDAQLNLDDGVDPRRVGAVVTATLCGHWDHPGPCRWPHNNEIDTRRGATSFRTVFVADEQEEPAVRTRIEDALRGDDGWRVLSVSSRDVAADERSLADNLIAGPRRST